MIYLTLHLILAHFIADFPLQSSRLVKYKQNHLLGIFFHSSVHFIISLLLAFPFIQSKKLWLSIAVIFTIHSIIDQGKVAICKHTKFNAFIIYLADQLIHVAVVCLTSICLLGQVTVDTTSFWALFYSDPSIVSFLLVLVLVTYFYDISKWVYLNEKKAQPYKRDYKGMIRNALIVIVAFGIYWITLP